MSTYGTGSITGTANNSITTGSGSGLTANQTNIDNLYRELFPWRVNADGSGGASFGTIGGADYWVDKLDKGATLESVRNDLMDSQEYSTGTVGGLDESMSMVSNAAAGNHWAKHFGTGGVFGPNADGTSKDLSNTIWAGLGTGANNNFGTDDAATAANNIASSIGYTPNTLSGLYSNTGITGGGGNDTIVGGDEDTVVGGGGNDTIVGGDEDTVVGGGGNDTVSSNWYDQFDSIDAFKDALGLGDSSSSTSTGGVDDFMKFMMFMSMMRPQGGMGGGSQYGYGGLNPGGVQSAYNPMDNITSAISAFQSLPGIGTNLTNTGTAAAA